MGRLLNKHSQKEKANYSLLNKYSLNLRISNVRLVARHTQLRRTYRITRKHTSQTKSSNVRIKAAIKPIPSNSA